ncbi:ImmA/IrrE family metallo-endopeptidase [Mesorhizobium ciceri]|uniref:ImmA/IrrE family metallo-endopeptidase n=1 Tax=Mesorhizobium TaxID=68287 RepID=UPI0009DDC435|nr:ImmA/IrrE family metallo-endopeptidase [Mesorhizobium ciceri]
MILTAPDYARVKREVRRIHEEFSIIEPPVNPVDIARHLGVTVSFVEFADGHKSISGFYDCEDNAIYVNSEEFPLRQTFTVAHELGHKVLHAEWARSADYKVLMRDSDYSGNEPHEKEANAFAGNLLVPRAMLDRYWKTISVEGLSKLFAVSVPMIKFRLSLEYGV